jgi:hypothetical protein
MEYMLLIISRHSPEDGPVTTESGEPCWMAWYREMTAHGVVIKDGAQLRSADAATTVAVEDGEVLLSDGPFAETKEQIVGYNVIECADLDEAILTASRHPVAESGGRVEIRPILSS